MSIAAAAVLLAGSSAGAGIVVFDRVSLVGRPVRLVVLTKGRLFAEGGQLVALSVGNTRLKRQLTGGDGYGYFSYTTAENGIKTISAEYEYGRGSGTLLVMNPTERAILVDVDTVLRESLLPAKSRGGSRKALEAITTNYRVIYLHGKIGLTLTRQWLSAAGLPPSAVLGWRNADILKILERSEIDIHAIIGSAVQMTASKDRIQHRISFEETRDGRQADSWAGVLEALGIESEAEPVKRSDR